MVEGLFKVENLGMANGLSIIAFAHVLMSIKGKRRIKTRLVFEKILIDCSFIGQHLGTLVEERMVVPAVLCCLHAYSRAYHIGEYGIKSI